MPSGRLYIDTPRRAADALARGSQFAGDVSPTHPLALYGAALCEEAIVLGAYQYAPHALCLRSLADTHIRAVRRRTGGCTVWGGEGVLYIAVGILDASVLMRCPPGRILNRNVRGALIGLRSLGVPTHYFGRDFLSFDKDPGAYVGWDETDDGRVLLEFFVALTAPFVLPPNLGGYPEPVQAPLRGRTPATLLAAGARDFTDAGVIAAIASGYAKGFGVEFDELAPDRAETTATTERPPPVGTKPNDDRELFLSDPHEEAIGFVAAGVRLDDEHRIAEIALFGDFFQHRSCPAQLSTRLHGAHPDAQTVGAALDAIYANRPGLIEGVRSLRTLEAAILQAAARAR